MTKSTIQQPTITSTLVDSDQARMEFMPKHFGRSFLRAENDIYSTMDRLCKEYQGGYWDFYELSNGGFFLAPKVKDDTPFSICVTTNYFEGDLSPQATGIVVCLFVISSFANSLASVAMQLSDDDERKALIEKDADQLVESYYALRDYATTLSEFDLIYQAID